MKEQKEAQAARPHSLRIDERRNAVITGVDDVDSFNEQMIVLRTSAGALTLMGEGLNVSKLSLEEGQLLVEGSIGALQYEGGSGERSRALKRLFR